MDLIVVIGGSGESGMNMPIAQWFGSCEENDVKVNCAGAMAAGGVNSQRSGP